MNYNIDTLKSGMRVIHRPTTSPVVYCGIAVKAGTRDERPGEEGLAHFCEHLTFKGTRRRTALQIINAIEGVGGEMNAFTNKEDTVYYVAIQRDHLAKAVDVLCDIVFSSQYPQAEVEKEAEVVCDEIESYEDSPSELIYDDIENLLFEGHPLGHNILGNSPQLRTYTSEDALRFTRRHYRPDNCVFFASGDIPFSRLCRLVEKAETYAVSTSPAVPPSPVVPSSPVVPFVATVSQPPLPSQTVIRHRATHQAHVMLGTPAYAAADPHRWALYLLNNLLGGPGLNSRLNLSLRERHGLVYTVDSSMVCYSDAGCWCVYFGCDPSDIEKCRRLVRHELDRLMHTPLTPRQLQAAKRQLYGQLAIACDNNEQFTLDFARNFLHHGKGRNLDDIIAHVESVTADDLLHPAQAIFDPARITTLIYQ